MPHPTPLHAARAKAILGFMEPVSVYDTRHMLVVTALLLAACHRPGVPGDQPVPCATGEVLDGAACVPEACGTGTWGGLTVDEDTVYVDASASEGDGSESAPLASIQAGADLAGERGGGLVAISAGSYLENVALGDEHDGVTLAGRCNGLVSLDGTAGDELPAIEVAGGRGSPEATIVGLTVTGGTYSGVWVERATVSLSATDIRASALVGIVVFGATVTLDDVGVYDTAPDENGDYGRGIDVEDGATLTATGCRVESNTDHGVFVTGAGTTVALVDSLVVDTAPRSDGSNGRGIEVSDGAALSATGCTLQGNREVGVLVGGVGTRVDLTDTAIVDTLPGHSGSGKGISVVDTAIFRATGCSVERNVGMGVHASDVGTDVQLTACSILDTLPDAEGVGGDGIWVQAGASLAGAGCTVRGNTESGVAAFDVGTTVSLEDTEVSDTLPSPDGNFGRGIDVEDGATLSATGCTVVGNTEAGVLAGGAGTTITLSDTVVSGTLPQPSGAGGGGVLAGSGASFTANGCTIEGNTAVGVYGSDAGTTVLLEDTLVTDTVAAPDGSGGRGVEAYDAVMLTAIGCTITGNKEVGLLAAYPATVVDLDGTAVLDTLPNLDGAFGRGVEVSGGASLTATGCTLEGNVELGLVATGVGTTVDFESGAVRGTSRGRSTGFAIGVATQQQAHLRVVESQVSDTEGPGAYVVSGATLTIEGGALSGNRFAGVVVLDASATITSSSVTGTVADQEWGGGFGVYATDHFGAGSLVLQSSIIGAHPYAAVWLDGQGAYEIEGNTLSAGEPVTASPAPIQGQALLAENGVRAWDGASGLRLSGNVFEGATTMRVLLDAAEASLEGNSWSGSGVDVWQQRCDGLTPLGEDDLVGVPVAVVCPAGNLLTAYDLVLTSLYVPTAETEE